MRQEEISRSSRLEISPTCAVHRHSLRNCLEAKVWRGAKKKEKDEKIRRRASAYLWDERLHDFREGLQDGVVVNRRQHE